MARRLAKLSTKPLSLREEHCKTVRCALFLHCSISERSFRVLNGKSPFRTVPAL